MSNAQVRATRVAMIALAVMGGTGVTIVTGQAFAQEPGRPGADARGDDSRSGSAPGNLQPLEEVKVVGTFRVQEGGAQVYTCTGGAFVLKAPEAVLADGDRSIHHFGGPSWQSEQDGSTVTAAKVAEQPVEGSIPELLLQVNGHSGPEGELSEVTFIQRLRTSGGAAPAGPCQEGTELPVAYRADYVFLARG